MPSRYGRAISHGMRTDSGDVAGGPVRGIVLGDKVVQPQSGGHGWSCTMAAYDIEQGGGP